VIRVRDTGHQRVAVCEEEVHLQSKLHDRNLRIWTCLIGGSLVWALHLIVVYPITSLTCEWGWFSAQAGGTWLKVLQTLVTGVALLLIGGAAFVARDEWRQARQEGRMAEGSNRAGARTLHATRDAVFALIALILNSLYGLVILILLIPIWVLPVCL
jgi:hypothetical protein